MIMHKMERIKNSSGFSGTLPKQRKPPKALKGYGIDESAYNSEK